MGKLVVSGLLVGTAPVLDDGGPSHPGPRRLWELAAEHRAAVLGVSPGYLQDSARAGLGPGRELDLSASRLPGSTGEPLPAQPYWVREHIGEHVRVFSTCAGTDIVSGFTGGAPTPVWAGEMSAPLLGVPGEAWDAYGLPVTDEVGELVVTRPLTSVPGNWWARGPGQGNPVDDPSVPMSGA
ncbi:hypothetical protein [Streptomyces albipurpureus]|uniref:Uncharacterized protein n=1 Tax=Streptomyces albipurpureus TaxID=2897419 RepID=A0ABT0V0V7_9ACTN|nr:hypothetical protein [Streptomyces sp. CWNU-1]MCM2394131.1 hypothetical protein [Streptomyces sp. CWNU-1]